MITVDTWPISQFRQARDLKTLTVSPEYQRRPVWSEKNKMLLIDSVARGVPIGAITLYVNSDSGYDVFEVIDGKQRLSALLDFLDDDLKIKTSSIASAALDDDEFNEAEDDVTASFHDKRFSELDMPSSMKLQQYKVPLFLVTGDRASAIRAFSRMNRNTYSLTPQEIRHAFYCDADFLSVAISTTEDLDVSAYGDGNAATNSVLVGLGAISKQAWDRMQDIQFMSELITLSLAGPQHRRDTLDSFYSLYRNPSGQALKQLHHHAKSVRDVLKQVWRLTDGTPLQAFHFPGTCEHDLYALVGALLRRGTLTDTQLMTLKDELMLVISTFRGQVEEYVDRVRKGQTPAQDEFDPRVENYGRGFLGGQTNAKARREDRIAIWVEVINGIVATLDPKSGFSETQRRLIWIRSADKVCGRCGSSVAWEDYHAGHIVAWASGGRTVVDNGRVEHASCNMSAGAIS